MSSNRPQAIIFDLEGTIIDTEPIWDETDTLFLARYGITYVRDQIIHLVMGKNLRQGVEAFQQHFGLTGDIDELTIERRSIMRELLQREITFIPGFQEFFAHIRKRYPVAIATSMERPYIASVDASLSLTKLFNGHIYSIEDIGHISKPNPDIFLYDAQKLSVDPKHCLVIEDAPNGIEAAHRAGMKAIALLTSTTRDRLAAADQIVDGYADIQL